VLRIDCFERPLDCVKLRLGLFSDKFQSDVQGFRSHPTHIRSKSANTVEEARNPVPDVIVNIERYEEAHKNSFFSH
jgi:hypothetical protein